MHSLTFVACTITVAIRWHHEERQIGTGELQEVQSSKRCWLRPIRHDSGNYLHQTTLPASRLRLGVPISDEHRYSASIRVESAPARSIESFGMILRALETGDARHSRQPISAAAN
jgi:hypothetical protein